MGCESNSSRTISETIYEHIDVNFKPLIHGLKMNRKWMANSEPNSGKRMQKLTSTFAADSKIQLKGCSFQDSNNQVGGLCHDSQISCVIFWARAQTKDAARTYVQRILNLLLTSLKSIRRILCFAQKVTTNLPIPLPPWHESLTASGAQRFVNRLVVWTTVDTALCLSRRLCENKSERKYAPEFARAGLM